MNPIYQILTHHGYPLRVYHGTRAEFERFLPLSHFGTRCAAEQIAQVKSVKSEYLTPNFPQDKLTEGSFEIKNKRSIIPAYLKMKNPLMIPDIISHMVENYKELFFNKLLSIQYHVTDIFYYMHLYGQLTGLPAQRFIEKACHEAKFMPEYHFIFDCPLEMPIENVKHELMLETLYTPQNIQQETDEVNRFHLVFQRLIRFCEAQGYDGFVYVNKNEDSGQLSYIIFRPEQVMRLDGQGIKYPAIPHPSPENESQLKKIYETSLPQIEVQPLTKWEIQNKIWDGVAQMQKNVSDEKIFWVRFALKKVMPKIARMTNQSVDGYHGLSHTEQVMLFGIDYALATKTKPLPVILACALHDCARKSGGYNTNHGPDCEPIARQFLANNHFRITEQEKEQIIFAIINHTVGQQAPDMISACLWDADRTRLSWEYGYQSKFFTTKRAKEVAAFSKSQQTAYLDQQRHFLADLKLPSFLESRNKNKNLLIKKIVNNRMKELD